MLCNGLEILRPVIEGRFGMLPTADQEYTTDQQGKERANRLGQTSPAGSNEAFRVAEYAVFRSVARVYAGRIGVANIDEEKAAAALIFSSHHHIQRRRSAGGRQ